jgi:hypothetical protein
MAAMLVNRWPIAPEARLHHLSEGEEGLAAKIADSHRGSRADAIVPVEEVKREDGRLASLPLRCTPHGGTLR